MPGMTGEDNLWEGHSVTLGVPDQILLGLSLMGGMFLGAFHLVERISGDSSAQGTVTHTFPAVLAVLGVPIFFVVLWRQSPARLRNRKSK